MFPIKTSYISLGDIGGTSYFSNTKKGVESPVDDEEWSPLLGTLEDTNFGPKTA